MARGIRNVCVVTVVVVIAWLAANRDDSPAPADGEGTATAPREARAGFGHSEAPAMPAITSGSLRLEGLVVDDVDRPVGGARVMLGPRVETTEQDGSFAFDGLAEGRYAITVEHDAWYGEDRAIDLDAVSDPVTIKLTLGPSLRVHVIDASGIPIEGAEVELASRTVPTGGDGVAYLRGLEVGVELLYVRAVGYEHARETVETGDDPEVTVEHTVVLRGAARIAGSVVDEAGVAVENAHIELETVNGEYVGIAESTETGAWELLDIVGGSYAVHASSNRHVAAAEVVIEHDGKTSSVGIVLHVARGAEVAGIVIDEAGAPVSGATVKVGPREVVSDASGKFLALGLGAETYDVTATTPMRGAKPVSVTLTRTGHADVTLVVVDSSFAGIVVDAHGNPVEDAHVYARTATVGAYERTDARGHFDLGGLPPGVYEVEVVQPGLSDSAPRITHRIRTSDRNLRFELPALATVTGRVLAAGRPVEYYGVAVTLEVGSLLSERPRPVRDATGRFTEGGLSAGRWSVIVVGPGFERRVVEVLVTPGRTVELGDLNVEVGGTVEGHVVDDRGTPIAGAAVRVSSKPLSGIDRLRSLLGDTYTTSTNARGEYRIAGISFGNATLKIEASRGASLSPIEALVPGQSTVDLVISASGAVDGTIANLRPPRGVSEVTATVVDGELSFDARVSTNGAFHFDHLRPGDYNLSIGSRPTARPQRIHVTAEATTRVVFELPSQSVRLVVHVAGECNLVWLTFGDEQTLEVCHDGHAVFDDVVPGAYQLCHDPPDCIAIEVPAQPELSVNLP